MTLEAENIERLKAYYDIIDEKDYRKFFCKGCNKGWQLLLIDNHPNNYLKMLDHAFGHAEIRRGEEEVTI